MIPDKLADAIVAGAKRAGVHAVRAATETLAAVTAFIDEVAGAFADDAEDGAQHIEVEPEEE